MDVVDPTWMLQWTKELVSFNPYHLALHGVMLCFIIYLLALSPFKPKTHSEKLTPQVPAFSFFCFGSLLIYFFIFIATPKEEEEIINEWTPLPLHTILSKSQQRNTKELIISKYALFFPLSSPKFSHIISILYKW